MQPNVSNEQVPRSSRNQQLSESIHLKQQTNPFALFPTRDPLTVQAIDLQSSQIGSDRVVAIDASLNGLHLTNLHHNSQVLEEAGVIPVGKCKRLRHDLL